MENIQNILSLIKQENLKNTFTVFVPSLKEKISFSPLTTNHQKTFVQNLLDSPLANSPFIVSSSQIIGECWLSETPYDPSILTNLDKIYILRSLLFNSYSSPEYDKNKTLIEKEEPVQELPEIQTLVDNNITIQLYFPSILTEAQYAKYIHTWTTENLRPDDDKTIHTLNSLLYTLDTLHYIKSLKIGETEIDFISLPVQERVDIGLSLSSKITETANKKIKEVFSPFIQRAKTLKDEEGNEIQISITNADFVVN